MVSAKILAFTKILAFSSSQPLANSVFLASSKISFNVKGTVLIPILNIIYACFSNLFLDLRDHQQHYGIGFSLHIFLKKVLLIKVRSHQEQFQRQHFLNLDQVMLL